MEPAGPPGQAAERESATSLDLMAEFAVLPLRIAMTMTEYRHLCTDRNDAFLQACPLGASGR